jgi:putative inorganic carbon (HCO3(-)) transporter
VTSDSIRAEAGPARLPLDLRAAETWTLRAGAVALPLAVWPIGGDRFVLARLAVLGLLVLALVAQRVAGWTAGGRLTRPRTPVDIPLAAFVLSAALSTVLAVNAFYAVVGAPYRYEGLVTIAAYALVLHLAAQALDREGAWSVARSLLLGGCAAALLGIAQSVVGSAMLGGATEETALTYGGWLRATSTFGNAGTLGAFLAMLLPLAMHELQCARSAADRLLAANVVLVLGLALVLTFSRAAWLGAALGVSVVAAGPAIRLARRRPPVLAAGAGVAVLGLAALAAAAPAVLRRAASVADPAQGSGATRLHIWADTLHLVAARPLVGWGPDTFGLVYPRFQSGDWAPGFIIDKAHSDLLQVAATQGVIGAAACLGVAAAFVAAFWRGRRRPGALAMLAAWLAYQVPLQLDFSWLPSAAPAWLLMGVALAAWRNPSEIVLTRLVTPRQPGTNVCHDPGCDGCQESG